MFTSCCAHTQNIVFWVMLTHFSTCISACYLMNHIASSWIGLILSKILVRMVGAATSNSLTEYSWHPDVGLELVFHALNRIYRYPQSNLGGACVLW